VKAGDLVWVKGTHGPEHVRGIILESWETVLSWWTIMIRDGEIINWPESQLEKINESR
jgi:hypothetical protein